MPESRIWLSLKEFVVHVSVGAIAFFFVSVIAVGLSVWVSYLEANGINYIIVQGLKAFEYMLFGLDLILAAIFLVRSMIKLVKDLW